MAKKSARRLRFTKTALQNLDPPESGRYYAYDTRSPSLALCVTAKGCRTFYFCKKVDGKPTRVRLGPFPGLPL